MNWIGAGIGAFLGSLRGGGVLGGIIGAVLSTRAKPRLLEMLFAAVTIFAGVRMLL